MDMMGDVCPSVQFDATTQRPIKYTGNHTKRHVTDGPFNPRERTRSRGSGAGFERVGFVGDGGEVLIAPG